MATILETAHAAGVFNTLLAAVDGAGLRGALEGPGPFTVFAPVDDAFAALPPGTVQTLVANPPPAGADPQVPRAGWCLHPRGPGGPGRVAEPGGGSDPDPPQRTV